MTSSQMLKTNWKGDQLDVQHVLLDIFGQIATIVFIGCELQIFVWKCALGKLVIGDKLKWKWKAEIESEKLLLVYFNQIKVNCESEMSPLANWWSEKNKTGFKWKWKNSPLANWWSERSWPRAVVTPVACGTYRCRIKSLNNLNANTERHEIEYRTL